MRLLAAGLLACLLAPTMLVAPPLAHAEAAGPGSEVGITERARQAHMAAQLRASRQEAVASARERDRSLNRQRTVVLFVGLLVFAAGLYLPKAAATKWRGPRRAALIAVALVALAAYYNFFRYVHAGGLRTTDNFHYYVGSKYFDELGYFGLYECSLVSIQRSAYRSLDDLSHARDLRTMEKVPIRRVLEAGAGCPDRFSAARWAAFTDDVRYFAAEWPPIKWRRVFEDYGYHPSPIWNLIGGSVAKHAPLDAPGVPDRLRRLDRLVIAAGLLAIGCVFGLEVACLAALLFGTGFLWRYAFVGDAFLRHLWWVTMIAGLCALRVGRPGQAGGWLCLSSSLRIFPAAIPVAYLAHEVWGAAASGERPRAALRFLLVAALTASVLLGLAVLTSERGIFGFVEFAHKISAFASLGATNKMGLGVVAESIEAAVGLPGWIPRLALLAGFGGLALRALPRIDGFEAAALGGALIPLLTSPTNYYYTFLVAPLLLAERRPRVGLWILGGGLAFNLNGMLFYQQYVEYRWASVIALVALAGVLYEAGCDRWKASVGDIDGAGSVPG